MSAGQETDARISEDLRALKALNIDGLRAEWRRRFTAPPPALRGPDLMRRALADQIQASALGRDAALEARIEALVRASRRGERVSAPAPVFRPGSILMREHQGKIHRVEVLERGFRWEGETYASLSVIARSITGVRWNGPRFFGLREAGKPGTAR